MNLFHKRTGRIDNLRAIASDLVFNRVRYSVSADYDRIIAANIANVINSADPHFQKLIRYGFVMYQRTVSHRFRGMRLFSRRICNFNGAVNAETKSCFIRNFYRLSFHNSFLGLLFNSLFIVFVKCRYAREF